MRVSRMFVVGLVALATSTPTHHALAQDVVPPRPDVAAATAGSGPPGSGPILAPAGSGAPVLPGPAESSAEVSDEPLTPFDEGLMRAAQTPSQPAQAAQVPSHVGEASEPTTSSRWKVDLPEGHFTWAYPIVAPPVAGGLRPDLSLTYDSGRVDGLADASLEQTSWVGEGFDLQPGFIERRYRSCASDGSTAKDLCWAGDDLWLNWGEHRDRLIRQDDGTGPGASSWRLQQDRKIVVKREVGADNGDDNGEYFVVTDARGMRYYFGQSKAGPSAPTTKSAWTVPVFGNDEGEPCRAATAAESWCQQAWRWNLDRVVDRFGNVVLYRYETESNNYARSGSRTTSYHAGGWLASADYGLREGSEQAAPAARLRFTVSERCLPDATLSCQPSQLTSARQSRWPDVPFSALCTSTCTSSQSQPVFFSRKRLISVVAEASTGQSFQAIDQWDFTHSFPSTSDGSKSALWLSKLRRVGRVGGSAGLLAVRFSGTAMPNRVDAPRDGDLAYQRYRVTGIRTERGANLAITYTNPNCQADRLPVENENTRRCFPRTRPALGASRPSVHWFHKYVARVVSEAPGIGATSVTNVSYRDAPAFALVDAPSVPVAERHWANWRGYGTIRVVEGGSDVQRRFTESVYHRGLHAEPSDRTGGRRSVVLTGPMGYSVADFRGLAGEIFSTQSLVAGVATASEQFRYFIAEAGQGERRALRPLLIRAERSEVLGGGDTAERTRTWSYDEDGFEVRRGVSSRLVNGAGEMRAVKDLCVFTNYNRNRNSGLLALVGSRRYLAEPCNGPGNATIASERYFYDGSSDSFEAPVAGVLTRTLQGFGSAIHDLAYTHDQFGRLTTARFTDEPASTWQVAYQTEGHPAGVATRDVWTSPDPDGEGPGSPLVTTHQRDRRGDIVATTDPNGEVTRSAYDPLGRRARWWALGRSSTLTPSMAFSYATTSKGRNTIRTTKLLADGRTTADTRIFNALGWQVQTQRPTLVEGSNARLATNWTFDSLGRMVRLDDGIVATGLPKNAELLYPTSTIARQTRWAFDTRGRRSGESFAVRNSAGQLMPRRSETTVYQGAQRVRSSEPAGLTVSEQFDAEGWVTRRVEESTAGRRETTIGRDVVGRPVLLGLPSGASQQVRYDALGKVIYRKDARYGERIYGYGYRGQLVRIVTGSGPERAIATFSFDQLGRLVAVHRGENLDRTLMHEVTYDQAEGGLGRPSRFDTFDGGAPLHTREIDSYAPAGVITQERSTFAASEAVIPTALTQTVTVVRETGADGSAMRERVGSVADLPSETVVRSHDAVGRTEQLRGLVDYASAQYGPEHTIAGLQLGPGGTQALQLRERVELGSLLPTVTDLTTPEARGALANSYDAYGYAIRTRERLDNAVTTLCQGFDPAQHLIRAWTPSDGSCGAEEFAGEPLGGQAAYRLGWTREPASGVWTTQRDTTTSRIQATTRALAADRPGAVSAVTTKAGSDAAVTKSVRYDTAGRIVGYGPSTFSYDALGRLAQLQLDGTTIQRNVYALDGTRIARTAGSSGTSETTVYHPAQVSVTAPVDGGPASASREIRLDGRLVAVRTNGADVTAIVTDALGTPRFAYAGGGGLELQRYSPLGITRAGSLGLPRGYADLVYDVAAGVLALPGGAYLPGEGLTLASDGVLPGGWDQPAAGPSTGASAQAVSPVFHPNEAF